MAEEEKQAEGNAEEGEGKSKKKLIIIIAIVAIVAIAASVGVTLFLLGGDDTADQGSDEIIEEVEELPSPAIYSSIKPPFLVTFNIEGRQRYMQISMTASSREASSLDAMEHHMPLIRSKIISAYSGLDFTAVQTEEGKLALREKTIGVINKVLEGEGALGIENVFFTNFVLQ